MTQKMSESEKKKEDWMNSKWRPMMGWSYMLTCIADFVIFPVLWSVLQSVSKGQVNVQWQPITLQGAGLYHIAMGAVLGIAAYGRTQEKLGGANNGGAQTAATGFTPGLTTTIAPSTGFGAAAGSFGSPAPAAVPSGSYTPAPSWGTTNVAAAPAATGVTVGWGGKKAPPESEYPVL